MRIYRLHPAWRSTSEFALTQLYGGRWNPPGVPMLYAAESLALCCLEVLVHLDKTEIPSEYVWSRAELLPEPEFLRFSDLFDEQSTQLAGRLWIHTYKNQLGVLVPSAILPESWNVLLNPNHPEYRVLSWSKPEPFNFDRCLFHLEAK